MKITSKEMRAVLVAWNELRLYLEVVGQEGDLDDEELPQTVLRDAAADLAYLLCRNGVISKDDAAVSVAIP
jgi:hypothetical protein